MGARQTVAFVEPSLRTARQPRSPAHRVAAAHYAVRADDDHRPLCLPPPTAARSAFPSRLRGSNQFTLKPELLAAFEQLDRSPRHDGRDRMLVDKLR